MLNTARLELISLRMDEKPLAKLICDGADLGQGIRGRVFIHIIIISNYCVVTVY